MRGVGATTVHGLTRRSLSRHGVCGWGGRWWGVVVTGWKPVLRGETRQAGVGAEEEGAVDGAGGVDGGGDARGCVFRRQGETIRAEDFKLRTRL